MPRMTEGSPQGGGPTHESQPQYRGHPHHGSGGGPPYSGPVPYDPYGGYPPYPPPPRPPVMEQCYQCNAAGVPLLVSDDPEYRPSHPTAPKPRFCNHCMLGKKVRVFWPVDESWYTGTVQEFDPNTGEHLLRYSDGDTEWVRIGETQAAAAANAMDSGDPLAPIPANEADMNSSSPPAPHHHHLGGPPSNRDERYGRGPPYPPPPLPPPEQPSMGMEPEIADRKWQQEPPPLPPPPPPGMRGGDMMSGPGYPPPPHYQYPGPMGYGGPPPHMQPGMHPYGMYPPHMYPPPGGPYGGGGSSSPPGDGPGKGGGGGGGGGAESTSGNGGGGNEGSASGKRKAGPKAWTKEEDSLLLSIVQSMSMPMKWSIVAQSLPERTGKQCRERYVNHLNPRLKMSEWSVLEDATVFHLYNTIGSHWANMSKVIPGRTDNGIKNRFHNLRRQFEREDENRLRLSSETNFPEEIRLDRLRKFPSHLKGKADSLWDMKSGIGILAAQSVLGTKLNRNQTVFGPFRKPESGELCVRCGFLMPSLQTGDEVCTKTGWCSTCSRIPPHISSNLLRECLNLRRAQDKKQRAIIESWEEFFAKDKEGSSSSPANQVGGSSDKAGAGKESKVHEEDI